MLHEGRIKLFQSLVGTTSFYINNESIHAPWILVLFFFYIVTHQPFVPFQEFIFSNFSLTYSNKKLAVTQCTSFKSQIKVTDKTITLKSNVKLLEVLFLIFCWKKKTLLRQQRLQQTSINKIFFCFLKTCCYSNILQVI